MSTKQRQRFRAVGTLFLLMAYSLILFAVAVLVHGQQEAEAAVTHEKPALSDCSMAEEQALTCQSNLAQLKTQTATLQAEKDQLLLRASELEARFESYSELEEKLSKCQSELVVVGESEKKDGDVTELDVAALERELRAKLLHESQSREQELLQQIQSLQLQLSQSQNRETQLAQQLDEESDAKDKRKNKKQTDLEKDNDACQTRLQKQTARQQVLLQENAELRRAVQAQKKLVHKSQKKLLAVRLELFQANERIRASQKLMDTLHRLWEKLLDTMQRLWQSFSARVQEHCYFPIISAFGDKVKRYALLFSQVIWHLVKDATHWLDEKAREVIAWSKLSQDPYWSLIEQTWCASWGQVAGFLDLVAAPSGMVLVAETVHKSCQSALFYSSLGSVLLVLFYFLVPRRSSGGGAKPAKKKLKME